VCTLLFRYCTIIPLSLFFYFFFALALLSSANAHCILSLLFSLLATKRNSLQSSYLWARQGGCKPREERSGSRSQGNIDY